MMSDVGGACPFIQELPLKAEKVLINFLFLFYQMVFRPEFSRAVVKVTGSKSL